MGQTEWAKDPLLADLEVYRVGGAVRDELLGLKPSESDYVIVGVSPERLVDRGFRPIGRDFPVFLHPVTRGEFALARTERKSAPGYRGFTFHTGPEVTLEQDLIRRDLTINAIAQDRSGRLIDPSGGRKDLARKILRHVSPAFVEDPVRLLRLARFATRFRDFSIAAETLNLCRALVADGEVDHLVSERVWQEMRRALMCQNPARFFEVLRETGALERILPEVDALFGVPQQAEFHPEIDAGVHTLMTLEQAARLGGGLEVRYACLLHDLGKALTPAAELPVHHGHEFTGLDPVRRVSARLKVPADCRDLALLLCEFHLKAHRALELRPSTLVDLLERLDAFRRPGRFEDFLLACEADKRGRKGREDQPYVAGLRLRAGYLAALEVDVAALVDAGLKGEAMAEAVRAERVARVRALIAAG